MIVYIIFTEPANVEEAYKLLPQKGAVTYKIEINMYWYKQNSSATKNTPF